MKIEINRFIHYLIICFGLLPIIPNGMTGILPVLLFVTSLVFYLKNVKRTANYRILAINSSLFFIYLISLCYTADLNQAIIKLGPAAWIVVFPLIFHLFLGEYRFKRNTISSLLKVMTLSTIAFIFIFTLYLIFFPSILGESVGFPRANILRGLMSDIPVIGKHPIYASLFVGISIIYCSNLLLSHRSNSFSLTKKISVSALVIFFIASLILIQGKGALLYLFFTLILLMVLNLKNKTAPVIILLAAVLSLGYFLYNAPKSNNRFLELVDKKTYSSETLNPYNSSQIRLEIWKSSIECIKKAPVFGYGLGDVQRILDENYAKKSEVLLEKTYNSHNQYLGIWLSTGILGLLVFINFLYADLRVLIRYRFRSKVIASLSLALIVFFMLNFITENILDRQLGALAFYFFINFLSASALADMKDQIT